MKINEAFVKKIQTPTAKLKIYFDSDLKGFGICITEKGVKSYILQKRMGAVTKRLVIARVNELSLSDAKAEAKKMLSKIVLNGDPFFDKKMKNDKGSKINEIFELYLSSRKHLKPKSIYVYRRSINIYLKDWSNKYLSQISKEMILMKHKYLADNHDPATANMAMKLLNAIYSFAQALNEDILIKNPVSILSQTKSWYIINAKTTYIKKENLFKWYESVKKCHANFRDYILFLLLTGTRKQEAATLKWDQVNFNSLTITFIDTKNTHIHEIPMTNYVYKMLFYRDQSTNYVFPGNGKSGYILDPRVTIAKIAEETGIVFTLHDLRRTFATIADSLDVSAYALKRLLNHRNKNDVTEGYIISDVERLRKPLELINNYILEKFNE